MSAREWLGVGLGCRRPWLAELGSADGPRVPVLELLVDHFLYRPELVDGLAERSALLLHDVGCSPATAGPLDEHRLARLIDLAERSRARAYSEHLAITRSPAGVDLGHLLAIPRTRAQLEVLVDHLGALQAALPCPVALELPATTLELGPSAHDFAEGDFLRALVDEAGCELLLDLENLRVDACNGLPQGAPEAPTNAEGRALLDSLIAAGVPPRAASPLAARLALLPLEAVALLHLAGGHRDAHGWTIDSHAHPVSATALALLEGLRAFVDPRAIVIERDDRLPALAEMLTEVEDARRRWAAPAPRSP